MQVGTICRVYGSDLVNFCLAQVASAMVGMHNVDRKCPLHVQLTQAFIPSTLWVLLRDHINKNLRSWGSQEPPATMRELELLFRLLFALGSFCINFGELVERKSAYPKAWMTVTSFEGTESQQVQRVKDLLRAMDPSTTKQSKDNSTVDWNECFSSNELLSSIETLISNHCRSLAWKPGFALCIDDDKMRNRSHLASLDFGFSRNKTPKSFGPVFNMVSVLGDGLFVGGTMSTQGDSMVSVNDRMMRRLCGVTENHKINMHLSTLANDRGYNGQMYHESLVGYQARSLNTIKREPSLPFSFGDVGYKRPESQRMIPENGPRSVFCAERRIEKDRDHAVQSLIGYRSGTGKVTLLGSTNTRRGGENWSLVPRKLRSWKTKIKDPNCNVQKLLPDHGVQSLTQVQGDPVWFAMRCFRLTSTTTLAVVRRISKETDKHRAWLPSIRVFTEDVGIVASAQTVNDNPLEEYSELIEMEAEEIANQHTKALLKKLGQNLIFRCQIGADNSIHIVLVMCSVCFVVVRLGAKKNVVTQYCVVKL